MSVYPVIVKIKLYSTIIVDKLYVW